MDKMSMEDKRKRMAEIFHHSTPNVIFVMSADIIEAPPGRTKSGYKSPSYMDVDIRGLLSGGKARVIAFAEAHKYFLDAIIEPNTRDRDVSRGRPTHARVYADELEERGVPSDHIELEENSVNTIGELVEAVKIAERRGWTSIAILSNDYHLPRIKEMWERLESLADPNDLEFAHAYKTFRASGSVISFVGAETILALKDSHYARLIRKVKGTLAYHVREINERKGIYDLKQGKYNVKRGNEV